MKIQNLAVIFIIIILPISIVLSSYTKKRVEVISMQSKYDSKLNDATHDAIKAYQLNSFKSDTSYYTNSKIRDIEASVNTFFNSLSTNFSTLGYTKETLQNYVPAIVYTMYDGYYIYTPYTNTWYNDDASDDIKGELNEQIGEQHTYANQEKLYGLKPYVYYSCRYRKNDSNDVTITYSLDNYIQIQGKVNDKVVSVSGYLYSKGNNSTGVYVSEDTVKYNGVDIPEEANAIKENIFVDGGLKSNLSCIKEQGTKYYYDGSKVFSVLNGKSQEQTGFDISKFTNNKSAKNYYKETVYLRNFIKNSEFLKNLSTSDIVDVNTGTVYNEESNPYYKNNKIFDFDHRKGIEAETSNFNAHRIDVIKNAIERNLSISIANFNNFSGASTEFQMPKLKDEDWDKIMNNISVISFLQGINMGGKAYNGYSIITNTMNEDVIMEDSIYIKKGQNIYDITENGLAYDDTTVGVFNINTEPRTVTDGTTYFLPVTGNLSYNSIITKNKINNNFKGNLREYIKYNVSYELKRVYYTALARERYGLYRPKLEISEINIAEIQDESIDIEIPNLTTENSSFSYSTTEWTRSVTVTANTTVTGFTLQTSKDGQTWSNETSQTFRENGTIYARLFNGYNASNIITGSVTNIDKMDPQVTSVTYKGTTQPTKYYNRYGAIFHLIYDVNVKFTALDNESGIIGYALVEGYNTTPYSYTSCEANKEIEVDGSFYINLSGNRGYPSMASYYTLWVKDQAGNTAKKIISTQTASISLNKITVDKGTTTTTLSPNIIGEQQLRSISYEISDTSIAEVTKIDPNSTYPNNTYYYIKGLRKGTTQLTAKLTKNDGSTITATCDVIVNGNDTDHILSNATVTKGGTSGTFYVYVNKTYKNIYYQVEDQSIASVQQLNNTSYYIRGLKRGTTKLTVTLIPYFGSTITATCDINVY